MATLAELTPHQTVRILAGKLTGLLGTVEELRDGRAVVHVAGVVNDVPVDKRLSLAPASVEVFSG